MEGTGLEPVCALYPRMGLLYPIELAFLVESPTDVQSVRDNG